MILFGDEMYNNYMQEGTWNVDCRVGSPCADGRGVFLLRRMGPCVGSCRVQVDFATPAAVDASAPSCLSNLPTYNLDHQPFTPSFMLPTDQVTLLSCRLDSLTPPSSTWFSTNESSSSWSTKNTRWYICWDNGSSCHNLLRPIDFAASASNTTRTT